MYNHQNRNTDIDFIKGIAIILVVFGHSIQFGSGQLFYTNEYYFGDIIFRAIYSFHMPLFAVISGYLVYWSIEKRNLKQMFIKQIKGLAVPAIVWNSGYFFLRCGRLVIQHRSIDLEFLKNSVLYVMTNLWFLWVMMLLSIIASILHYYFDDSITSIAVVALITLCLPDKFNLKYLGFLYPFYMAGYFAHSKKMKKVYFFAGIHRAKVFIISFIIWSILLCFFNKENYIYTSGFGLIGKDIIQQLYCNIFRFMIGILGCITVLGGVQIERNIQEFVISERPQWESILSAIG